MKRRNIVLVGFMGSGKSHIGRKLAMRLGWQFVDTDRILERKVGMSIADYYALVGEQVFRQEEHDIICRVSHYHEAVISFGGNFVLEKKNFRVLKEWGYIIALQANPQRIIERVGRRIGKRPTMDYEDLSSFVFSMIKRWKKVYPYCDYVVDTTKKSPSFIVDEIKAQIEAEQIQFIKRYEKRSTDDQ